MKIKDGYVKNGYGFCSKVVKVTPLTESQTQEDLLMRIAELESDNIRLRRMLKDFIEEPLKRILGYD